jgi:hypothetical protein
MIGRLRSNKLLWLVAALNGLFWVWFWVEAWRNAIPYTDRPPKFEEIVPVYKFGDSALPPNSDVNLITFRSLHLCQAPTLFLVARTASALARRGWDERFGPLSLGAWVLIITNAASFVQWWLIGLLVLRLVRILAGEQAEAPGDRRPRRADLGT